MEEHEINKKKSEARRKKNEEAEANQAPNWPSLIIFSLSEMVKKNGDEKRKKRYARMLMIQAEKVAQYAEEKRIYEEEKEKKKQKA